MNDPSGDPAMTSDTAGSITLLRAGPITATFEHGALRWLRWGEIELVRGVYMAVRDDRWRTIVGELDDLNVVAGAASFEATFSARHHDGALDFRWLGRIVGSDRGSVQFTMDGVAESTFERNRIGFCVLHPMSQAGSPLMVMTPHGTIHAVFPEHISPSDPFTDITGLRFPVSPTSQITIQLEGDLFEMEDQRNWTDASFKTFCTPHRYPYPVLVRQGTGIRQSVTIELAEAPTQASVTVARSRALNRPAPDDTIEVHDDVVGKIPSIGTTLAPGRELLDPAATDALQALHPAGIRTTIELDQPGWEAALSTATHLTGRIGARLEIEVVAGDDGQGLPQLLIALANQGGTSPDVYVYPTTGYVTTALLAERLRELATRAGVGIRVGGGSRANFAEFNRAELPTHLLDVVGFAISPQVHAFDDASILESIAAQAVVVRDAQRLVAPCELVVGPITLLPRFNPYTGSRPSFGLDTEVERRDPRQDAWFAAAWTLASLVSIAGAGATDVSYHEVVGPAGMLGDSGSGSDIASPQAGDGRKPVHAVMSDVLGFSAASRLRSTSPADVAVLALHRDGDQRRRVLVANLRNGSRTIQLRLPASPRAPIGWSIAGGRSTTPIASEANGRVVLGPYEVIRFDVEPV